MGDELKGAELDEFLDTSAEVCFIQDLLEEARFQWFPWSVSGPQCADWDLHAKLHRAYTAIAEAKAKGDDEDEDSGPIEDDDEPAPQVSASRSGRRPPPP